MKKIEDMSLSEREQLASETAFLIRKGWTADNALNAMTSLRNQQVLKSDSEVAVEDRINMNLVFDVFELQMGQTVYEYQEAQAKEVLGVHA